MKVTQRKNKWAVLLAAVISGILFLPARAFSGEELFDWTPFESITRPSAYFHLKHHSMKWFFHHDGLVNDAAVSLEKMPAGGAAENSAKWDGLNLFYFKIYLSSVNGAKGEDNCSPWARDRIDKMSIIKSLPSLIQTVSTRETFETLGTLIEPQVMLGISF